MRITPTLLVAMFLILCGCKKKSHIEEGSLNLVDSVKRSSVEIIEHNNKDSINPKQLESQSKASIKQMPERRVHDNGVYIKFKGRQKEVSILDYSSIKIPDNAKIEESGSQDKFYFDIQSLNEELRGELVNNVYLHNGRNKDDIKVGNFIAYCGAGCNDNACAITYHINLRTAPYSEVIAQKAEIVVFDNSGELLRRIEANQTGATSIRMTDDGKFIMAISGGEFGEGGAFKIENRYKIFDVQTGEKIFESNRWRDGVMSQDKNLFFVIDRLNDGTRIYNLINPAIQKIYTKVISDELMANFKEWTMDGLLLRDGSFLDFEDDFKVTIFNE